VFDKLSAIVQTLADEVDEEEEETGEVDEEEVELVDERGAFEDDFSRFAELHLVEHVESFVAHEGHSLLVEDGRDVVQRVLAQLYLEDVVVLDDGQLRQVLDLAHQLHRLALLHEVEVYLVLLCHPVQHLPDQVLLEVHHLPFDQAHRLVLDHQVVAEVVLHVHFVGRVVFPHVPTLNIVIIKDDSRKVVLLLKFNCFVTYPIGFRERGHEIRGEFEANFDSVLGLGSGEVFNGGGKVVAKKEEVLGGTSGVDVGVVERDVDG
jgi:hypothetical protein